MTQKQSPAKAQQNKTETRIRIQTKSDRIHRREVALYLDSTRELRAGIVRHLTYE